MPKGSQKQKDDSKFRKRSTRACDQCRKTKSKCERIAEDGPCESCTLQGLECNFSGPINKRGPAKGYLHAVETRCHAVEAVLGVLLGLPDQRAISLLTELSEDPYAARVLDQVNTSAFGSRGRNSLPSVQDETSAEPSKGSASDYRDPFVHGPTNEWQDAVIETMKVEGSGDNLEPFGTRQSIPSTPSSVTHSSSDTCT